VYVNRTGVITRIDVVWLVTGTSGSSANSSLYFRLNNTTDTTLSTTLDVAGGGHAAYTSLTIAVTAGDYFEFKWTTPAWNPNNPTGVYFDARILYA
jgi:glycine/serine hydroxymethyltransferase